MHIEHVLAAVDFSPPSTLAVNHALELARKFKAQLTLLHAVDAGNALLRTFPAEAKRVQEQRRERAEKMLLATMSTQDQRDLNIQCFVRIGDVEQVVEDVVCEEQADLVVIGTHGRTLLGRLLIGSVAEGLLRKLGVPILTVCRVWRPFEFKRILFATDLAPGSNKAFRLSLEIARTTGAALVVAHTIEKRPIVSSETPEVKQVFDDERRRALEHAHEKFAEFETEGKRGNVNVWCVLSEGDASDALVRIADENVVDFIVLAIRKKRFIARAFLGSTAEPVIRNAHVPVLSVPVDADVSVGEDCALLVEHLKEAL